MSEHLLGDPEEPALSHEGMDKLMEMAQRGKGEARIEIEVPEGSFLRMDRERRRALAEELGPELERRLRRRDELLAKFNAGEITERQYREGLRDLMRGNDNEQEG